MVDEIIDSDPSVFEVYSSSHRSRKRIFFTCCSVDSHSRRRSFKLATDCLFVGLCVLYLCALAFWSALCCDPGAVFVAQHCRACGCFMLYVDIEDSRPKRRVLERGRQMAESSPRSGPRGPRRQNSAVSKKRF